MVGMFYYSGGRETPALGMGSECHTLFVAHMITLV